MNTATKPRNLKRTDIGPSRTVFALMVKIDWTSAKTVTITATKDFGLPSATVDARTGQVAGNVLVKVLAGTTLHFVASSFDGWYYVGRMSHELATCTCGHFQNRHNCKHQLDILAAHYEKVARQNRQDAAAFVDASAAIEQEAEEMLDEDQKLEKWTEQELANVPQVSSNCPTIAPETPTVCLQERLQTASLDERRAIWKQVQKDERIRNKENAVAYWAKVHAYHQQAV